MYNILRNAGIKSPKKHHKSKLHHRRKRKECEWKNVCEDNCETCDEIVSYCRFYNIIEYGDFPLGDGCKICDENECGILTKEDEVIATDEGEPMGPIPRH